MRAWRVGVSVFVVGLVGCDGSNVVVLTTLDASDADGASVDAASDAPPDVGLPDCPSTFVERRISPEGERATGVRVAWTGRHLLALWRSDAALHTQRLDAAGTPIGASVSLPGSLGSSVPTFLSRERDRLVVYGRANGVFVQRVDDDGLPLGEPLVVSATARVPLEFGEVAATVHDDGGLSLAWPDERDGGSDVFVQTVDASFARVGEEVRISASGVAAQCRIVASAGGSALVWSDARSGDNDLRFAVLDRAGQVRSERELVPRPGFDGDPRVAPTATGYLVVYTHERDLEVLAVDAGGVVLTAPRLVTMEDSAASFDAMLLQQATGQIIAWQDRRDGNLEIYVRSIGADGIVTSGESRLTNAPANSYDPMLVDVGGQLHIVWIDERGGVAGAYHGRLPCDP